MNRFGICHLVAIPTLAGFASAAEIVGPWNLTELFQPPPMQWIAHSGPVHSLTYQGEVFNGERTEVFAFYASPFTLGTARPGAKVPGVVLIHGGGGTAFAEWAWLWAKRGYAAIAMDLSGRRPPDSSYDPQTGAPLRDQSDANRRTRLARGGPEHGQVEKYDSIGGTPTDDWPFHAVASVIRAHSLLRSLAEVDAERTAVTGISWGGYTTCLAASLDHRFKAAVPVYGAGFLHEGESVQKASIDRLGDRKHAWVNAYEASRWLPRCRVPIFFVNGTNDIHNPLDSYQKSFAVVPGAKFMRIEVNMRHGHPPGWAPPEIGLFIDTYCRGGAALPVPGKVEIAGENVRVPFTTTVPLKSAALHFTTDTGLRSKRTWKSIPAKIEGDHLVAPKPPAEANPWFLSLTDERDAMITTEVEGGADW